MPVEFASARGLAPGSTHCRDQVGHWFSDDRVHCFCVVRGLGNRQDAIEASTFAINYLREHYMMPLHDLIHGCHRALAGSAGVFMGIASLNLNQFELNYCGIGTTRGLLLQRGNRYFNHTPGVLGKKLYPLESEHHELTPSDIVMLYTGGLFKYVDLSCHPRSRRTRLPELARSVHDDWSLQTDDSALLLFRPSTLERFHKVTSPE